VCGTRTFNALMTKDKNDSELGFTVERVTGIEPVSRAWEPSNDALVQALTCDQPWSGVTLVDRDWPRLVARVWHDAGAVEPSAQRS
jgi:hypothetical protein